MNIWFCTSLIIVAGALGGFVNALISNNGFALPRRVEGIWCPGALSTILIGAFAAFVDMQTGAETNITQELWWVGRTTADLDGTRVLTFTP
jgi:hypothetical protein